MHVNRAGPVSQLEAQESRVAGNFCGPYRRKLQDRAEATKEKPTLPAGTSNQCPKRRQRPENNNRSEVREILCRKSRLRQVAGMQDGRRCAVAEREDKKVH
jgi:hypothetical protein